MCKHGWHRKAVFTYYWHVGETKMFQKCKITSITYMHNSSAWITCALFKEMLTCLDRRMATKRRKILLSVDQCTVHSKDVSSLNNVRVEFLPTSVLQLMDQGIIRSLKQMYCKHLVCRYIECITNTKESYKVPLLDII
jgi:hypothetical protein